MMRGSSPQPLHVSPGFMTLGFLLSYLLILKPLLVMRHMTVEYLKHRRIEHRTQRTTDWTTPGTPVYIYPINEIHTPKQSHQPHRTWYRFKRDDEEFWKLGHFSHSVCVAILVGPATRVLCLRFWHLKFAGLILPPIWNDDGSNSFLSFWAIINSVSNLLR